MSLLEKTRHLLRTYNISPQRRLGQSFMISEDCLQQMVSYASVTENDVVLEIGAGLGVLTKLLSQRCKRVIAVEADSRLARILRKELEDLDNVELIEGNLLEVLTPSFNKAVSNPPFYISSPILFWLLEKDFDTAVLTFQKEFAERLVASVGSKDYGRLTVMTYYKADAELLDLVPKSTFYPPPSVDSHIVKLKPKPPPFDINDKQVFFEVVRTLFSQRNKKVRNAITRLLIEMGVEREKVTVIADSLPYHDRRVQKLAPEDFGAISNAILKKSFL